MDSNKGKLTQTQAPKGGGSSSSRGGSGASTMNSVNWGTQLKRKEIAHELTNVWRTKLTLRLIPSSEVEESAKKFENDAFVEAKNSSDYVKKMFWGINNQDAEKTKVVKHGD